jgi:hypothetical protein
MTALIARRRAADIAWAGSFGQRSGTIARLGEKQQLWYDHRERARVKVDMGGEVIDSSSKPKLSRLSVPRQHLYWPNKGIRTSKRFFEGTPANATLFCRFGDRRINLVCLLRYFIFLIC